MSVIKWYMLNTLPVSGYLDPGTAAVTVAGANLVGGMMGADATKSAANTNANAQLQAAQIAANAAKFKPYNLTTGFGTSAMTDSGGSYTLDPTLQNYRNQMYAGANQALPTSFDPTTVANQWYQQQQDMLAPDRERSYAQLQTGLFNSGRGGLAVGATGARPYSGMAGDAATNPELAAYYNSINNQNLQLQNNAMNYGNSQLDAALNRSKGMFTTGTGVEQLGLDVLNNSANIGNKVSATNGAAATLLANGMTNAANTQYQGQLAGIGANLAGFKGLTSAAGNYNWGNIFGTSTPTVSYSGSDLSLDRNPTGTGSGFDWGSAGNSLI